MDSIPPDGQSDAKRRLIPPGLVAAVLITVALIFFVVQNDDEVAFSWLFFDMTGPLWVVIVVAALAGAVLSQVVGFVRRRRLRRAESQPRARRRSPRHRQ